MMPASRTAHVVAALLAMSACAAPSAPATGTVRFSLPANCPAFATTSTWRFYADGTLIGTAELAAGQSAAFPLLAGQHAIRFVWAAPTRTYDVTVDPGLVVGVGKTIDVPLACIAATVR